jgi:hypothetical protein
MTAMFVWGPANDDTNVPAASGLGSPQNPIFIDLDCEEGDGESELGSAQHPILRRSRCPHTEPESDSGPYQVRGAIIAIEGLNTELVTTMVTYLENILANTDDPIATVNAFPALEANRPCFVA